MVSIDFVESVLQLAKRYGASKLEVYPEGGVKVELGRSAPVVAQVSDKDEEIPQQTRFSEFEQTMRGWDLVKTQLSAAVPTIPAFDEIVVDNDDEGPEQE